MKKQGENFELSASDLVAYLNCQHLSDLDRAVAEGVKEKPKVWDPLLEVLWERGAEHEKNYVQHLQDAGFDALRIEGVDVSQEAVSQTIAAMKAGQPVIVQGALAHNGWIGRADILRRVETPSAFGTWSYEVIDTKLARETKAGAVLQLCLYADLLCTVQDAPPEHMYVVAPWSDFEPQAFRYADYAAYFRKVKRGLREHIAQQDAAPTYPDPKDHCDICRWRATCDQRRREDDHLCLVAGISKSQISELNQRGISTADGLAQLPLPLPWKPGRGSASAYERVREQARIQVQSRESGEGKFELLPVENGFGLTCLPAPSQGDIFFDLEGDPFVGEHGLEYLFGYQYKDSGGESTYTGDWAFSRAQEKQAFEAFVDFVMERWKTYPDLHIYHYAPYEPGALKRLMGRYATREEEIDQMLRAKLFVDLYSVVRQGLRASVESYSIKKLEPFYGFARDTDLQDANKALRLFEAAIELDDAPSISQSTKDVVRAYNQDDCASAQALRDWLESLRDGLIASGTKVPRPEPGDGAPSEKLDEWLIKIHALMETLTADVPIDPEERTQEQQARWILANILDWHRRENKAVWWEYFRLADLSAEDLLEERAALSRLSLVSTVDQSKTGIPTHRYRFVQQDTDLRGDEDLKALGGEHLGKAIAVSTDERTIDIRKTKATADIHPEAVFSHTVFDAKEQAGALVRLGEYVAEHGMEGDGPYRAGRALLLNEPPRLGGQPIRVPGETGLDAALRVAGAHEGGVFPIQGPPGTGKSYTGARMICRIVEQGKKVGITANSHKVIRNLLDKVLEAAEEMSVDLCCIQKPKEREPNQDRLIFAKNNGDVFTALASGRCQVAGATHFLWSRADAHEVIDVLVVDEAAQMSLANVLAVAQSARTLILLGDPQQLDQPTQGTHPDSTGVSSLEHVLQGEHTIVSDRGLFLEQTWRLHPDICAFNSELFYDGKLTAIEACARQVITSSGPISGSGLRYLPVPHTGNKNSSIEEAEAIAALVQGMLAADTRWTDRDGDEHPLTLDGIVIITPYNAQVFEIQQRLHGARVGTVDKFQGQEAPIAIYSMATSSYADAPRGMEFLYSLNRFNVATSRAKCLTVLIGSPQIFEAECHTPRQMQLANAFCRYAEMARDLEPLF